MGARIEPLHGPLPRSRLTAAIRSARPCILCAALALGACAHGPSDAHPSAPATATPGAGGTVPAASAGGTPDGQAAPRTSQAGGVDVGAEMARGRESRRQGRYSDAAIAFERVIRADPTAFDARLELAEVLLVQSIDLGRAKALLDEARSLRAYDPQVDQLRAWLDELRGDPAAAAADYARVLAANPDPEIRLRRASLLLQMNRVDDALAEYEKVAAERPTDRATRATLAGIYEYRGRLPDAERMLTEIVAIAPGEIAPLRRLADFYRRTAQYGKQSDAESRVRALEGPPRVLRPLKPSVR